MSCGGLLFCEWLELRRHRSGASGDVVPRPRQPAFLVQGDDSLEVVFEERNLVARARLLVESLRLSHLCKQPLVASRRLSLCTSFDGRDVTLHSFDLTDRAQLRTALRFSLSLRSPRGGLQVPHEPSPSHLKSSARRLR
jgi:hypothetical protein